MPLRRPPRAAPRADGGRTQRVRQKHSTLASASGGGAGGAAGADALAVAVAAGRGPFPRRLRHGLLEDRGVDPDLLGGPAAERPGGDLDDLEPTAILEDANNPPHILDSVEAGPALGLDIPDGGGIRQRLPDLLGQRRRVVVAAVAGPLVDPLGMLLKVLAPSLGHLRGRQRDGPSRAICPSSSTELIRWKISASDGNKLRYLDRWAHDGLRESDRSRVSSRVNHATKNGWRVRRSPGTTASSPGRGRRRIRGRRRSRRAGTGRACRTPGRWRWPVLAAASGHGPRWYRRRVGVHQHLEPLDEPVAVLAAERPPQVRGQRPRLDAAEQREARCGMWIVPRPIRSKVKLPEPFQVSR